MDIGVSTYLRDMGINPYSEEGQDAILSSEDWSGVGDVEVNGYGYVVVRDADAPERKVLEEIQSGLDQEMDGYQKEDLISALIKEENDRVILEREDEDDHVVVYTAAGRFKVTVEHQVDNASVDRWVEVVDTMRDLYEKG